MTKDTIIKFFNNRCTETELNEVIGWINAEAFNEKDRSQVFEIWKNYQEEDNMGNDEKFSLLFDKIQQKIDLPNNKTKEHRIGLSVFTTWLTRAAAILLIPVLTLLFYTLSEHNSELANYKGMVVDSLEIVAPIGSRTVVHLSDGSEVHLNYGSKLKYPQVFSGESRGVVLTGEGYFNVAHNPEKPFIVDAGKLNVKALGTEFDVMAYPEDDVIETTLVNGKVVLTQNDINGNNKTIGTMTPGQHVNYNTKNGVISSSKGNIENYTAWKSGKLVFEDTPIIEIANKLSRMFNVEIEVDESIKDYYYTVTFIDEPLFQILDLITIATPVSYKALPRTKLSDGTFSKQKITIERKNYNKSN